MSTNAVFGTQEISHTAQIGVSIEPENNILQLTPATVSFSRFQSSWIANKKLPSFQQTNVSTYFEFGKKMLENFFNFSSSFSITQNQMVPNPSETFVPLSTLSTWFQNFQRRLEQNPDFWKFI
jgi:hypothetical protein